MKGLHLLLLASMLVVTGSCSMSGENELNLKRNVKQILFFSNETDYTKEATYYDALIDLKKSFPAEIKNMMVLSPSQAKDYNIKSCPALLVIYNSEVLVKISGNADKEDIIHPISEVLSSQK
jgi:hypothetical protein